MVTKDIKIDLVYLWVDGSDPRWLKKKQVFTNTPSDTSEMNAVGRYANNDELKYALRSAEKYAPWIRQIFIVTDDQKPEWLNTTHPKIRIVDHTEIMPPEILPCFNSSVIEYFLYKIPGLSEHFLLANDDTFFNAPVTPDFFFESDGFPIVRLKRKPLRKWHFRLELVFRKRLGYYNNMLKESSLLVEEKFGKYYSGIPHHNIDAYRKSDYQNAVEVVFAEQVNASQAHHIRAYGDLHRSAFGYYILAIGHAHVQFVGRKDTIRILAHKHNFQKRLQKYSPKLFCLNDSQRVTDEHRKKIIPFFESLFPTKSSFEKSEPVLFEG